MSLTASIAIIVVIFARLLLRRAPAIFSYVLWAVVLFRLVCPVSLSSELSLMGAFNVPDAVNGRIEYISTDLGGAGSHSVTSPVPDRDNDADPPSGKTLPADGFALPLTALSTLWICGAGTMLIFNIVQLVRLRRRLIGAVVLRDNIRLADHISTPFVMGLIRPVIYLPSDLSDEGREYIILHEKHHIRRGDHIIKPIAFAAMCLHWFNPLVWVAFVLAGKDMEMSCDEAVMKTVGRDVRAEYSMLLLRFSAGKKAIIGAPLAFGEGDTKERIKNVMKYRKPTFITVAMAVVVGLGLTACLSSDPKSDSPKSDLSDISIQKLDLSADTGVGIDLAYESDDFIVFYGSIGLFGYDLSKKEITFSVDFMKAVGVEGSIQGSRGTSVEVSSDGKKIVISDYDAEKNMRYKTCYIDLSAQTYTHADYLPLQDVFDRDTAKGYVYPGVKTEQVKYILGDTEWSVFAE
jgi:beta-lactamase regulating signal transducer with metallopeptidase domain